MFVQEDSCWPSGRGRAQCVGLGVCVSLSLSLSHTYYRNKRFHRTSQVTWRTPSERQPAARCGLPSQQPHQNDPPLAQRPPSVTDSPRLGPGNRECLEIVSAHANRHVVFGSAPLFTGFVWDRYGGPHSCVALATSYGSFRPLLTAFVSVCLFSRSAEAGLCGGDQAGKARPFGSWQALLTFFLYTLLGAFVEKNKGQVHWALLVPAVRSRAGTVC